MVYNSYTISHLVIIIIIIIIITTIQPPRIYYTNIFTTQYNLTYTHCNSCPPYTFTNQILTNSLQLAAMIIYPNTRNIPRIDLFLAAHYIIKRDIFRYKIYHQSFLHFYPKIWIRTTLQKNKDNPTKNSFKYIFKPN